MEYLKQLIPLKIKRKLKFHLNEFSYRVQTKSFKSVIINRGIIKNGLTVLRSGHRSQLFAVEDSFSLNEIRVRSHEKIQEIIKNTDLISWNLPSRMSGPNIISILAADRDSLWSILSSHDQLNHWYAAGVDNQGRMMSGAKLVADFQLTSDMHAVRLFERVAFQGNLSFRAGALQGVEIRFWEEAYDPQTEKMILRCPVWHEYVAELPSFNNSPIQFMNEVSKLSRENVSQFRGKIDIVYTWVDGSDPSWIRRKTKVENETSTSQQSNEANNSARFKDNDELRFSLRSIYQYAPWVNSIFIVTDRQRPDWLVTDERVKIVDHQEIWPDKSGLPTFNSHAIESCIHRIPGLSEYFLYFNDDVMLTRSIDPELFFYPSGISKVFWSKAKIDSQLANPLDNASTIAAKNAREAITARGHLSFSRKFYHTPAALRKSVCEEIETEFSTLSTQTRHAQFRSVNDVALAGSFYFNYGLSTGNCVPGSIRYDYIDPSTENGRLRMQRLLSRRNLDCIVINDGASIELDYDEESSSAFIKTNLQYLLPIPSPWERER
ncbi:Stealth CR1 domain-containing protein [Glutamicibacter nicotianae]|uniref:Stealth CR1 domain-containing protein n=1 Tax=Glutamicibacter nicotianae TaxID=37929 RepID=UPI00195BE317|nr:Stealth CR1 domain-containing protein [Glutamicibacter nicotianae]MBM7768249.1 hypothetical protein [Glutamicibacter nicotianae]